MACQSLHSQLTAAAAAGQVRNMWLIVCSCAESWQHGSGQLACCGVALWMYALYAPHIKHPCNMRHHRILCCLLM